ncbi:hypothetical protein Phou_043440 [Phytohabitans houttuyneae]|uniref:Uncharacterized protein n=1 Tax=Phytohabitans houttuyneae TaxID=1076126 RepID=A0A6V8K8R2_9ACTN|nr:hypothetical protein Phou_043440 [Phytohabitans houttuyneae]
MRGRFSPFAANHHLGRKQNNPPRGPLGGAAGCGRAGAAVCGGAGVAFVAYRDATEPDRSSPDVAVSNYLRALLLERNDVRVDLYSCRDDGSLAPMRAFRAQIEEQEKQYSITIVISWGH